MGVFSHPEFDGHEKLLFGQDAESGLKAIIAIHNSSRGPALGGCRFWNYASEAEAITDVLRLSRGMTYKSALANLPFGGGKSVIIGDQRKLAREPLFRAMGRLVDSLGGRYVVAEDVGTSVADVDIIAEVTKHMAGGTAGGIGDPSPATAFGVFVGIRTAVRHKLGRDLEGVRVAVQGLGHVGQNLCRRLKEAGAELLVADIDQSRVNRVVEELGAQALPTDRILAAEAEVFAPCALGAVINDDSLPHLKASVVAGAANNQLAEPRHGEALRRKGVLYAPDYVINAGGVIALNHERVPGVREYDAKATFEHIARIEETLSEIFLRAERAGVPTNEAADRLAEERFTHPRSKAA